MSAGHTSGQCVVLVDEYDKPIVDCLDDHERALQHRDGLKALYGNLKKYNAQIEQVIITGVSAFSKVSIFSDLNRLVNLTLHPAAQYVVGITASELESHFKERLNAIDIPRETVRAWYNGYQWGPPDDERVYNPWSTFSLLSSGQVENYWFETGTPSWLVRQLRDEGRYELPGQTLSTAQLLSFDLDRVDATATLFQTGYLTIVGTEMVGPRRSYRLDYPNPEVRESFLGMLLEAYTGYDRNGAISAMELTKALSDGDLEAAFEILDAAIAGVPYDLWGRGLEQTFHAVVHLTFSLLGVYVRSEVHTGRGRCDSLVKTDAHIYAFEFKRDKSAAEAITQIRERGYLDAFSASAKTRHAVGVSFDSAQRRIGEWATEEVF